MFEYHDKEAQVKFLKSIKLQTEDGKKRMAEIIHDLEKPLHCFCIEEAEFQLYEAACNDDLKNPTMEEILDLAEELYNSDSFVNCEFSSVAAAKMLSKRKKKVLWFSRHEMTDEQKAALGNVEINQVNKTISSAYELKDEIEAADIIAIVAPINLQQQFLALAGDKPVIMAVNDRILIPSEDGGEDKVQFQFVKWERLIKIEVSKEDFLF